MYVESMQEDLMNDNMIMDLYEILDDNLFLDLKDVMPRIVEAMSIRERLDLIDFILALQGSRRLLQNPCYPVEKLSLLHLQSKDEIEIPISQIGELVDKMSDLEKLEIIDFIASQRWARGIRKDPSLPIEDLPFLTLQSSDVASSNVEPGSHTGSGSSIPGSQTDQVTVEFLDEHPGVTIDFTPVQDSSFYNDYIPSTELARFLERPLRIQTITWTEGSTLNTQFQPWDNFFHSTAVAKKLDNFAFLSCNLHVKFILNASPFYYGASIASYCPLTAFNADSINSNLNVNNGRQLIALSQRPHIKIFPQTNQGGELILPFFYYKNWLYLNSRADFQNMGTISMNSFSTLQNAGVSAGSGITITVYAWATEVRLMGATTNLSLQARNEFAEPNSGLISAPASAVARIARSLTSIPVLGPYAKATEMISSGIGSFASLFGFTNAPNVEAVCPLKNFPFPDLASTDISTPIDKLTMDPKQELTVDTRCVGLDGTDEMMISNIVTRESYLTQFNYTHSNVTDDQLFLLYVSPTLLDYETSGAPATYVASTPMSHISNLFAFWRGDIVFRFRFICSKFHRGRVILQWDPTGNIGSVANAANLVFTKIIDISEETDIEVRIPYCQSTEWLTNGVYFGRNYNSINYSSNGGSISPAYDPSLFNGYLSIKCLTVLTSPTSTSDIEVLVSVRGAENLEFANPVPPPQQTTFFNLHSADLVLQSNDLVSYDEPIQVVTGEKTMTSDINSSLVYIGEKFVSLRNILRRVSFSDVVINTSDSTNEFTVFRHFHPFIPRFRGYDPNGNDIAKGVILTAVNFPYNYANVTPYNWLAYCYRGYRGSSNWTYNQNGSNLMSHIRAQRINNSNLSSNNRVVNTLVNATSNGVFNDFVINSTGNGHEGESLLNQNTQTGLQVQYPMYSRFRMRTTDPAQVNTGSTYDGTNLECALLEEIYSPKIQTSFAQAGYIEKHFGIGTDFSFVFFLNIPTVIILNNPTPA